jgi:phage terminase large subunit-like protein
LIPPEDFDLALEALDDVPEVLEWLGSLSQSWGSFRPRPDRPELFDEQASFCHNRDRVAFHIGGNASGTTEAACYKLAQFVLHQQPPPRRNTPFWVISDSYEQVCEAIWVEKLIGHGHIPEGEVQWDKVDWFKPNQGWPFSAPLKPWPRERGGDPNKNWRLEFKSFGQGRARMQARSIGGFLFSEQFPVSLFIEVLRGCRESMVPGGCFAEFTPIDPELCLWVEKVMDNPPAGWRFYRANTELNRPNLAEGWYEDFLAVIPDEMKATRITGALASFEGVIYQAFHPTVHVVAVDEFPKNVEHFRGIDFGASEEHPFACVWGWRDGIGDWYIYDEYWNNSQSAITADHIQEINERSKGWGWPRGVVTPHHRETFADPARPGEINALNVGHIPTFPAGNDVYKGIDCVRSLLKVNPFTHQVKLRIHPRCKHLIEELRKYRWLKGRKPTETTVLNPKVAKPVPLKRDDDTADALRYMIYSAERGRGATPGSVDYRQYVQRRSVQLQERLGRAMRGR